MIATIILEDGTLVIGKSFGVTGTICGELVFNTGMTGYQEILTDPSYAGQIVTMTYPLIGNYGVNATDVESNKVQVSGFIVKEYAGVPNHWQCEKTIDEYLKENNIIGVYGIDTRMLTKKIRMKGAMKCMVTTQEITPENLIKLRNELEQYNFPKDIVSQVSSKEITNVKGDGKRVGIVDLGLKKGIVKQLVNLGCDVTVFPYNTTSSKILESNMDVLLLSNGPGDPKDATHAIETTKELMGKMPLWGICLGHQILALAMGADTYKLKFGHRGANHPVIELESGKVYMSSQNHGYAVKSETITNTMQITHVNVNDETIEGISCKDLGVQSVQFHPEEGPGPEDAHYLFKKWLDNLERIGENNV
ncbi:MAG: carbamoyl phosphate synthase small subunit [Firmicutes bacterium HGW-Firmicutes-1]|jgi:carbamoyl-phosphate synthase small subunit|nr:MAG: carbamoyl phosphate synthase small subunit [Firmicutes bacterium HGW-Firmicutes-1]